MKEIFYSDGSYKFKFVENDAEVVEEVLEKGWYYFDDETFQDVAGPFLTEQEAKNHLEEYKSFLNSEPKVSSNLVQSINV